jgi:hypothetical protein
MNRAVFCGDVNILQALSGSGLTIERPADFQVVYDAGNSETVITAVSGIDITALVGALKDAGYVLIETE